MKNYKTYYSAEIYDSCGKQTTEKFLKHLKNLLNKESVTEIDIISSAEMGE